MEKLKPCPFCGGKAEYQQFANPKHYYRVRCIDCHCCTDGFRLNASDNPEENKAANATVWNNRRNNWISVEERLPDNSDMVLIVCDYDDGKRRVGFGYIMRSRNIVWQGGVDQKLEYVTHWQPLPEPSKGDR